MMIEQNTNYAYKLKYMDNPTFDKVRDLSTKFYRELPQALQDELFEALNRGIDILDSEPQMTAYLFAFGKMHQAKLDYAFGKLPEEFLEQPEINIIDYGCGQALGTMCYADFLRENGYTQKVKTITLIEPSEICLKRAALHVSVFFPDAVIKTVNKEFDDLTQDDIACSEGAPTLHILSNVLDILDFDLEGFAGLIKGQIKGYNQFVCVSPYFKNYEKDIRMRDFSSVFCDACVSKVLDKKQLTVEKDWTCQMCIFSTGSISVLENLSTEVIEKGLAEAVEDEYGVMYSKDGKKLLKRNKRIPIETYSIRTGTKVICDIAFLDDISIKRIIIPDSVKRIGDGAFEGCKSLEKIIIPEYVEYIGPNPFSRCGKLNLESNSACFIIQNGLLINTLNNMIIANVCKDERIIIPDSITAIGSCAFCGCVSLKEIIISNSVTSIGESAFFSCKSIMQIIIPDSVNYIDNGAFSGCKSLRQISIPNTVTSIREFAFSHCEALTHIQIPNSVTTIEAFAFCSCEALTQIQIPNSVTTIGQAAFFNCKSLIQVQIPSSVTTIGMATFKGCESLIQVQIPNSITCISNGTFEECKSLQQIIIPNSVENIDDTAFVECESLQMIAIHNSMICLGKDIFLNCHSLQKIIIPKGSLEHFKEMLDKNLWDKLVER